MQSVDSIKQSLQIVLNDLCVILVGENLEQLFIRQEVEPWETHSPCLEESCDLSADVLKSSILRYEIIHKVRSVSDQGRDLWCFEYLAHVVFEEFVD